jgi:hypothetical protein
VASAPYSKEGHFSGQSCDPCLKEYNHGVTTPSPKLSDYDSEEEKLRKLYDQARAQGNRKKKKEYKEKIAELNRIRKYGQRESNKSKS